MFKKLADINTKPELYQQYSAPVLWNDPHISSRMLEFHLNPDIEPASRKAVFIEKSAGWIKDYFGLGDGKQVCDFGCGPGLYTSRLAATGADVTGIDFSSRSISYARDFAASHYLDIHYIEQNYLEFATPKQFDLITLIYCDYCALSPSQRCQLLSVWNKCLKDDGNILLDVFSLSAYEGRAETAGYEYRLMDGFWSGNDYFGFINTFKYPLEKVVLDKYTLIEADREWQVFNWLKYFCVTELKHELAEKGFEVADIFSDVAGAVYWEGSPEIAVVARKIK
ncbi:MAG: SAM-dependent methyltransferase [Dehalococcoides mccartyi]|uniref:class I SAM-dependent methyltransferase n=1 Tax=Dehalococcoides TaxID=61434 RepID=UPI0002B76160|nr:MULTISPECIES: class I SAM-dependent methyltransferase [Dehalococcoides]AGG06277.1 SAM-dependent methyltransferase [Dehalococcoides mccartyi DCMB5]OBW63243.1 MAG: SAM-dependent methyltransferase [Dehalococcoides mccartyi]